MSRLRPECRTTTSGHSIPDDTALFLIRDAVARRRVLIHGRLDGPNNSHCALGCFWSDNPRATLHTSLIDEVAVVNDSIPPSASTKERWKVKVLAAQA